MKLTLILVVVFSLAAGASTIAQNVKVSLKVKNASLQEVFSQLTKQTEYNFLCSSGACKDIKVTLNAPNTTLGDVLTRILDPKTYNITYGEDKTVIITRKQTSVSAKASDILITGRVTDGKDSPLPGASVVVKGTKVSATTDNNGIFTISVPDENAVLMISFIGFSQREVPIKNNHDLTIVLQESSNQLVDVVVVGYGTQRKIDVTGSVGTVKGADIAAQPSTNVLSGLQGKIAGVQINNTGSPGSSPQVRIRGVGTISGSLNPLFVVDGVWVSDISYLNSADIESISVLKDASTAAIYGNLSANGVILITTKKGKAGPPVVSYNASAGWQHITNQVKMANAYQYATLANEVSVQNTGDPVYDENTLYNPNTSDPNGTDWFRQVLRDAFLTNHQLSFSGASDKSSYNFSLSALDQNGLVNTQNYKRYTARLQSDYTVKSFLKVGYNLTGNYRKSNDINGDIFRLLYAAPPVLPVRYADGKYGDPLDYSLNAIANPQVAIDFNNQNSQNYGIIGNAFIDLQFSKKINFRSTFNYEFKRGGYRGYTPVYAATFSQFNTISSLNVSRSEDNNWMYENTLLYKDSFGAKNSFSLLLGQTARRNQGYYISGTARNVPYDYGESSLYLNLGSNSSDNPTTAADGGSLETGLSYFGRINYSYANKYLFTGTLRADGSSKYSGDQRWGYFPAFGLGWILSEENFMKNQQVFNLLKLRGSWGITGNTSVPANITQLTASNLNFTEWNGVAYPSRSINTQVPSVLFWEKGYSTDIALEAEVLNSRLLFEVDLYNRDTRNAIFDIPTLSSLGTGGGIRSNQATIRNRGIELSTTWRGQIGTDFSYSVNANYSYNSNEVKKVNSGSNAIYGGFYSNPSGIPATKTVLGQAIGQFWGYEAIGVFQTAAEVASSPQSKSAAPGDLIFKDQDGDDIIDDRDKIYMGNPNPRNLYGLSLNVNYKNFSFAMDLQGIAGVQIYNANLGKRFGIENFTEDYYNNRWYGPGTSNTYPSANILRGLNTTPNTFWVENGSYLRIRNIQAGYTFKRFPNWNGASLKVYSATQNPFNFFRYRGFSPEVQAANNSPLNAGIDQGVYPLSAIYNFGINLTF